MLKGNPALVVLEGVAVAAVIMGKCLVTIATVVVSELEVVEGLDEGVARLVVIVAAGLCFNLCGGFRGSCCWHAVHGFHSLICVWGGAGGGASAADTCQGGWNKSGIY